MTTRSGNSYLSHNIRHTPPFTTQSDTMPTTTTTTTTTRPRPAPEPAEPLGTPVNRNRTGNQLGSPAAIPSPARNRDRPPHEQRRPAPEDETPDPPRRPPRPPNRDNGDGDNGDDGDGDGDGDGDDVPPDEEDSSTDNDAFGNFGFNVNNADMRNFFQLMGQAFRAANPAPVQHPPQIPERAIAKEPERFDGSNPKKLNGFLMSCELVFLSQPRTYGEDTRKVAYALSYLSGTAQEWFQPYILVPEDPPALWTYDWPTFKEYLEQIFGEPDAEGRAEIDLNNLHMKETHTVARYTTDFNSIAARLRWDQNALASAYYRGLANRIKDVIAVRDGGRPRNLNQLHRLAQNIDNNYWQRHEERKREVSASASTSHANPRPNTNTTSRSQTTSTNRSGNNANASTTTRSTTFTRSSTPGVSSTTFPRPNYLVGKLTNDNRLTAEERQRRIDNNLCLYCGKGGHMASDCRLAKEGKNKNKSAPRARAAITESAPEPDSPDAPSATIEPVEEN